MYVDGLPRWWICPAIGGEVVGAPGFEPGASCSQSRRATRLRHAPTLSEVPGEGVLRCPRPLDYPTVGNTPARLVGRRARRAGYIDTIRHHGH